jgi:hypothetical protein
MLKTSLMGKREVDYRHIAKSAGVASIAALIVTVLLRLGLGESKPWAVVPTALIIYGGTYLLAKQDICRLWKGAWQ